MKLKLLFLVMDVLTLIAYPIVFAYGMLCQVTKPRQIPVPVHY